MSVERQVQSGGAWMEDERDGEDGEKRWCGEPSRMNSR
jgi:hypothetical protein